MAANDSTFVCTADQHRLSVLQDTVHAIRELTDEQSICDLIVREAVERLDCERASVMLADGESRQLTIRSSVGIPEPVVRDTVVAPGERISGKAFASGEPCVVSAEDPMPEEALGIDALKSARSFLSVPLVAPEEKGCSQKVIGVINATRKKGSAGLDENDLKTLEALADIAATGIVNCRLLESERCRRHLQHQLDVAADMQSALFPRETIRSDNYEVAGTFHPAHTVGGDFFDFWQVGDRLCFLLADVTGHDYCAGLLATSFRSVVRTESGRSQIPEDVVRVANDELHTALSRSEKQITALYGELHGSSGRLTYCRCGHQYPLVLGADGVRWLQGGGMALGILPELPLSQESISLRRGDLFVVYTDGVVEAGVERDLAFGRGGLERVLARSHDHPVENVNHAIIQAAREHTTDGRFADDVTVLSVRLL